MFWEYKKMLTLHFINVCNKNQICYKQVDFTNKWSGHVYCSLIWMFLRKSLVNVEAPLYMQYPAPHFYWTHIKFTLAPINYILTQLFDLFIERECITPGIKSYLDAEPKHNKFKVGGVLKFHCRERRVMLGADSVQCYHFGWSPNLPTCKGKYLSYSCWNKS